MIRVRTLSYRFVCHGGASGRPGIGLLVRFFDQLPRTLGGALCRRANSGNPATPAEVSPISVKARMTAATQACCSCTEDEFVPATLVRDRFTTIALRDALRKKASGTGDAGRRCHPPARFRWRRFLPVLRPCQTSARRVVGRALMLGAHGRRLVIQQRAPTFSRTSARDTAPDHLAVVAAMTIESLRSVMVIPTADTHAFPPLAALSRRHLPLTQSRSHRRSYYTIWWEPAG